MRKRKAFAGFGFGFKFEKRGEKEKMPLKIKTYSTAFLLIIAFVFTAIAQETTPVVMSSADVMRERVAKARAYIVVKNYGAAIYELNNIKRESADPTVHGVVNVLLMNSFLEQGDYKNAQNFLNDLSKDLKANKPNAAANYFAVASQVVKGAKSQFERYRALGFNVSDRNLPKPATDDIEKMRETLELVITQSKELGKDAKNMDNTMALLEGATAARGSFAKDDYDANRWKMEVADAREQLTNSRSTVINAVTMPQPPGMENTVASTTNPPILPQTTEQSSILLPVSKETLNVEKKPTQPVINKPSNETVAKNDTVLKPVENPKEEVKKEENKTPEQSVNNSDSTETKRNRVVIGSAPKTETTEEKTEQSNTVTKTEETPKDNSPLSVGSLVGYATKKPSPVYPSVARSMRMTGIVKVEVVVDEEGKVSEVQNTDGPTMLQAAAQDAVRKWKFKPFTRDGEPVRATGFVSFNFSL
jgi:TonB family protein